MTYNFDPERWWERELAALQTRHERGELDDEALATAVCDLEARLDEMVQRLDGSFTLP